MWGQGRACCHRLPVRVSRPVWRPPAWARRPAGAQHATRMTGEPGGAASAGVAPQVTPFPPLQGDRVATAAPGRGSGTAAWPGLSLATIAASPLRPGSGKGISFAWRGRIGMEVAGAVGPSSGLDVSGFNAIATRDACVNGERLLPLPGVAPSAVTFLRATQLRWAGCAPTPRRGRAGGHAVRAAASRRVCPAGHSGRGRQPGRRAPAVPLPLAARAALTVVRNGRMNAGP